MNCLRCGRDTKGEQNFCNTCLEKMKDYPVHPRTVIQLPRPRVEEKQPGKKRILSAEEHLEQMKKILRWMISGVVVLLVLIGILTALLVQSYQKEVVPKLPMGRNYSVTEQTE